MITLVSIMKNEQSYIVEWVAYHRVVGVDRLRIYENGSDDQTLALLQALHAAELVELIEWANPPAGESPQVSAYNHAVQQLGKTSEWLAFIDADEFIVPVEDETVGAAIDKVVVAAATEVGAIAVNWRTFGSSGRRVRGPGLVMERFTMCAPDAMVPNNCLKTIARASSLESMHIHLAKIRSGAYVNDLGQDVQTYGNGMTQTVSHKRLQINHYMVKSLEEFSIKRARGNANYPTEHRAKYERFDEKYFAAYDINVLLERRILKFLDKVKAEVTRIESLLEAA